MRIDMEVIWQQLIQQFSILDGKVKYIKSKDISEFKRFFCRLKKSMKLTMRKLLYYLNNSMN